MDLLGQLPSPTSLPQLEAVVLLPFGIAVAVGPLWTAFLAVATSAAVWLWRASSVPTVSKTAKLAAAVPASPTSQPDVLPPSPPATAPSSKTFTGAGTSPPSEEKRTPESSSPASIAEQHSAGSRQKVMWVFQGPEFDGYVLTTDDRARGTQDAHEEGGANRWDGNDRTVRFWGDKPMGWDEDGEPKELWAGKKALCWPWKEMWKEDLGWYAYQDRTIITGSVVRLWDGDRSPRRRTSGARTEQEKGLVVLSSRFEYNCSR